MTSQGMHQRRLTAWGGAEIITSVAAALVGGAFLLEGMLGYFYNTSIFLEGWNHIAEIFGGIAVAAVGIAVAAYLWVRR
jgi:hypothetical protein